MYKFEQTPPLSLYIHLPWCLRKCPYCDFNSHAITDNPLQETKYVDALLYDLEAELPGITGRKINSIFFGGGTPSLFSATAIQRVLEAIAGKLELVPDVEITLEANPGAADGERFKAYRAAGVNRLSIGIQSFDDDKLHALGRVHSSGDAGQAIRLARQAGFENINLDIMYGLPQQTLPQAMADIRQAINHAPPHISWYQLTLEPNTVFYQRPPPLPDEDASWDMQQQGQQLLREAGYQQYEVSAYATPDRQCRHNLNYWQFGDYLGIGAGAHGKITDINTGNIKRSRRHRSPQIYLDHAAGGTAIAGQHVLKQQDVIFEFMLNVLRLTSGFSLSLFEQRTGLPAGAAKPGIAEGCRRGLLEYNEDLIRPTLSGRNFLNDLLQIFL